MSISNINLSLTVQMIKTAFRMPGELTGLSTLVWLLTMAWIQFSSVQSSGHCGVRRFSTLNRCRPPEQPGNDIAKHIVPKISGICEWLQDYFFHLEKVFFGCMT